jgi:hypothetical protein
MPALAIWNQNTINSYISGVTIVVALVRIRWVDTQYSLAIKMMHYYLR